jgi:hypothetical protein
MTSSNCINGDGQSAGWTYTASRQFNTAHIVSRLVTPASATTAVSIIIVVSDKSADFSGSLVVYHCGARSAYTASISSK